MGVMMTSTQTISEVVSFYLDIDDFPTQGVTAYHEWAQTLIEIRNLPETNNETGEK
jgi:hypothetical protein